MNNDDQTIHDQSPRAVIERIANTAIQHERLPMLDVIFDRSVQLLTESFLHMISTDVRFGLTDVDYGRFGDALASQSSAPMIGVIRAQEWGGTFLIALEAPTMLALVEMLLGGDPDKVRPSTANRRPSAIELRLATRIIKLIAERLAEAFSSVGKVTFEVERVEMNTQFAAITRAPSAVVQSEFTLKVAQLESRMSVIVPYTTLEPVRSQLQQMFLGERLGHDDAWSKHFLSAVAQSQLSLEAVMHQEIATIAGIMDWKPGVTLTFDTCAETDVRLICGDEEFFRGPMGRKNGRIAVQIEDSSIFPEKEKPEEPKKAAGKKSRAEEPPKPDEPEAEVQTEEEEAA